MNNNPLNDLIRAVTAAPADDSSVSTAAGSGLTNALAATTAQLDQLRGLFQSQIEATNANTERLSGKPGPVTAGGGESAGDVAQRVAGYFTGSLALNPIVAGILKFFGGGSEAAPAPLEKFSLPASVAVDAGYSSALPGLSPADYGANGLPRIAQPGTQTINVHVNAMDSRSFLDRSDDIASAVRKAMLESSSLNDVVAEL